MLVSKAKLWMLTVPVALVTSGAFASGATQSAPTRPVLPPTSPRLDVVGGTIVPDSWVLASVSLIIAVSLMLLFELWRSRRELNVLTRRAEATIERRVAERTAELDLANAMLLDQLRESRTTESRLRTAQATLEETTQRYALLSELDSLTNLANRRKFDEFLEREWRRGARSRQELALLLVDVDYFKLFNDTYGHGTGDDCLRSVAEVIAGAARRPGDLAARIGGEEFAVLLCDTGGDGALIVARQIHAGVEQLAIDHETTRVQGTDSVSVSVGVVCMLPDTSHGPNLLFYHADEALYSAKQAGRNCVRNFDEHAGYAKSEASLRAASPSLRVHETLGRRTRP